jgi:hypothetical protein
MVGGHCGRGVTPTEGLSGVRNRLSLFAVTVRLGDGADHDARWQTVVTAMHGEARSNMWRESAACFLFESPKSAQQLCDAIFGAADIYDDRDLVVVINLSLKAQAQPDVMGEFALDAPVAR